MRKRVLLFLIVVLILSLALRYFVLHKIPAQERKPLKAPISQLLNVNDASPSAEAVKVLGHPLIKGGARSVAELQQKIARDPKLAAFYEQIGFDASCVHMESLKEDTWARVAYRDDDTISYSKNPVLMLAGELVFVDCNNKMLRARCANAILAPERQPSVPTADESFSQLIQPMNFPIEVESLPPGPLFQLPSAPAPASPVIDTPSGQYPVALCCLVGGAGSPPRLSAEENPQWIMLLVGLSSLIVIRTKRKPCKRS